MPCCDNFVIADTIESAGPWASSGPKRAVAPQCKLLTQRRRQSMTRAKVAAQEFELLSVSEQLNHLVWIHGTSVQVQNANAISTLVRQGSGTRIEGQEGTSITLHFALPTPMFVSERRLSIRSVILDFITRELASVTAVQVWDGRVRIASFEGLSLSGEHRFEKFEIEGHPSFSRGINVSVQVGFAENGGVSTLIDFISVGAEFVTKSGGLIETVGT